MQIRSSLIPLVLLTSLAFTTTASGNGASDIVGTWLVEEKTGKIQIFRCGDNYCGKTVWIKPTAENPNPEEKLDLQNPDPKKRTGTLLGSTMMWGLTYNKKEQRWEEGHIYDSRSGKTYNCRAELIDGGRRLKLRGYIGISLIGGSTVWTRLK